MTDGRPSSTARLIAAATVLCEFDRAPDDRAPAGAAEWCAAFLSTSRADRLLLRSARSRLGRFVWRTLERAALPDVADHWMRRKREIDRLCRLAARDGFSQLLVLGAGLDSLAFRMDRQRLFTSVFTADHPATFGVIDAALMASASGGGVHRLAVDLAHDGLTETLRASPGFVDSADTLVVVEGVLMYLRETDVRRLLTAVAMLPNPRKRLIGSWMRSESEIPIGFHGQSGLITRWLRRCSEPMLWASTPEEVPALLHAQGWPESSLIDISQVGPPASGRHRAAGEWLFVAESDRRQ